MKFHPIFLILPYTRLRLPFYTTLMDALGIGWRAGEVSLFQASAHQRMKGRRHKYVMNLNLSDWSQRWTFFTGEYYEDAVLSLIDQLLKPGDIFVDIGTNIGMVSLHARRIIGKSGYLHCFEPNPACAKSVTEMFELNGISNFQLHEYALGQEEAELDLQLTSSHTGTATLAKISNAVEASYKVKVKVGDNIEIQSPAVIKIDVEGFELNVLKGLSNTLLKHNPFVITELIDSHLHRAGTSVAEVRSFLEEKGYTAYSIGTKRRHLISYLDLRRVDTGALFDNQSDYLWVPRNKLEDFRVNKTCLGFSM